VSAFAGLAPCVHCGFCLQSCPTYLVTADEADGPRGRIVLMRQLASGALTASEAEVQHHLDRCLGCRGCEPVCPSGVRYGSALEAAREMIQTVRPLPTLGRGLLDLMASASLRPVVLGLARLVRPLAAPLAGWSRVGFAAGMLAGTRPWGGRADGRTGKWTARRIDGSADRRIERREGQGDTVVFLGCIQRELFGHVNEAAARTLGANGFRLVTAPHQGCCGALHAHAGRLEEARALARENVRAFARLPDTPIAVTAAGCGAMLRSYGDLLDDDPLAVEARACAARVRDVTELLADAGPQPGGALPLRAAYDPPCHLLHAQGVADPPRTVLAAIPDLEVVAHDEAEVCCGSAGVYSLLQPALSHAVLRRKLAAIDAVAPDVVVTGNPGCAMQLAPGLGAAGPTTGVAHPVELLDASYAAAGRYRGVEGTGTS
jgi:glycolate oxidase iron-sulfur subunit